LIEPRKHFRRSHGIVPFIAATRWCLILQVLPHICHTRTLPLPTLQQQYCYGYTNNSTKGTQWNTKAIV
jgi:hypothetical protein